MKLSDRLAAIASFVAPGATVADIGTDHAYLPIYLIKAGIATQAIAGDVHAGPFQVAEEAVAREGLGDLLKVRFGNGLEVLSPNEVDTVIIAGMGATTIIEILNARPQVVKTLKRLILQPMVGAAQVRRWLLTNGWFIEDETLIDEDDKLYEIITATRGIVTDYEPILYEIGPLLWKKHHPLLSKHIAGLIYETRSVVMQMDKSELAKNSPKYYDLVRKLEQLEAKQQCL